MKGKQGNERDVRSWRGGEKIEECGKGRRGEDEAAEKMETERWEG